jgi:hypothetical protein
MLKIITPKETNQNAVLTAAKRNDWGYSEQYKPEDSRCFRNEKREYLKHKIDELEANSKNDNIRVLYWGIYKCKRDYKPRSNLVKVQNGHLPGQSNKLNFST